MTSTTTSSLWAQALTAADLEVISHSEAAAAVGGATEEGLPWSPDGVWPLPEAQVKLLAFELLLLCRPLPPSEDEMAARGGASGLLAPCHRRAPQVRIATLGAPRAPAL